MVSWLKLTYHHRLFAGLVLYSLLLLAGFTLFQYQREKQFKAEELDARLQTINTSVLNDIKQSGKIPEHLNLPSQYKDLRVSIIDRNGRMVYDNFLDTLPEADHRQRDEVAKALCSGHGYAVRRHSESTGNTYFYSATAEGGYIVRTAVPYSVPLLELLSADYAFIWVMVGVTIIMCTVGFFITRRLGRNVERLRNFAACAEAGKPIRDPEPFPHDELGETSHHIIRLYVQLQQAIADRDREHKAALHQEQEKIRIKHQLTNNINHELKTPVASMQVCLETLLTHPDLSAERRDEFLNRCYAANLRLGRLLNDVGMITRLDEGSSHILREPITLNSLVNEICRDYTEKAMAKGVEIHNSIHFNRVIQGNSSLLASVFHNLIDNALSYSGCRNIYMEEKYSVSGRLEITVRDDGCGVSEEHLPHLFERFYRIDKGRSRRAGGTGLGLSIVKNAILWHGGNISVTNDIHGGLRFTFTVPVEPA